MTKDNATTLIQQFMDDSGIRWSSTGSPSNLDLALDGLYDSFWAEIMVDAPYIRSTREVIAVASVAAPGYLDTSEAGGLLTERLFRVQKLYRNAREYSPELPSEFVIDQTGNSLLVGSTDRYFFMGDELWMTPFDSSSEDVDLRYSHFPTAWNSIATGGTAIEWPDGHELAFVTRAAAALMAKGSVESVSELERLADRLWQSMMAAVKRKYPGPQTISGHETARSFGSAI
jgi:hypothetical protein